MLTPLLAGVQPPPPQPSHWPVAVAFVAIVVLIVVFRDLRNRFGKPNAKLHS
jgi:hypothetical protein